MSDHVEVELLMAFRRHRWDTVCVKIPAKVVYPNGDDVPDREAIIQWVEKNLEGQARYRSVVCWQLYAIPVRTQEDDG